MPPILDAAIGTFFVFMLFSIAVTALNEVVLTFFDKRADFLRLGLGELLGDSQKDKEQGYVHKLVQYSSQKLDWVIGWALGLPIAAWCAGADGETMTFFGIITLGALTRLGWFYAERQGAEKKRELDDARKSGNEGVVMTMQAKVLECDEKIQRKKSQFRTITRVGVAIALLMGFTAATTLFAIFSFAVAAALVIWLCGGFSSLLVSLTDLWVSFSGKELVEGTTEEFYGKQKELNQFAKDQQDKLNTKAAEFWHGLLAEVEQVSQQRLAVQETIASVETKYVQTLEDLQKVANAVQIELQNLAAQKAATTDAATLDTLQNEEKVQQDKAAEVAKQMQVSKSEKDGALEELRKSLPLTAEELRAKAQQAVQDQAAILQTEVERAANTKQAELSEDVRALHRLRPPLLSIPFLSLDPAKPPVNDSPIAPPAITVKDVFSHPLIFSLSKGDSDPSYISGEAFTKALLDLLVPAVDKPLTKESIKESIQSLANEKLKTSLAALNRSVNGEVELFKKAVEDWFNLSMQRVSGWYKRHAQTWLIILAFILAVVCNVDSIRIIQELSNSPNLARAIAAQAESYVKTNAPLLGANGEAEAKTLKDKKVTEAKNDRTDAEELLKAAKTAHEAADATGSNEDKAKKKADFEAAEKKFNAANLQLEVVTQWDPRMALSAEAQAAARQRKDEKIKEAKDKLTRLKKDLNDLQVKPLPTEVAAQKARLTEEEKLKSQITIAEKDVDDAVGWEVTLAQFQNDLKALRSIGIPMGWDEKTKRLFNILKTPEEIAKAAQLKQEAESKEAKKPEYQRAWERMKTWIWQPITWLETNMHRPKDWNWSVLFPALCGWALTALAASLGAPFWFDILQRIMNIRANGRAPDEKDLGTKKSDPVEVKTSTPGQPTSTTTISAGASV